MVRAMVRSMIRYGSFDPMVRLNLQELGWYRTNNFISNTRLEYKNLLYVCKSVCHQSLSNAENILRVREVLWLTDSVAKNALQQ